MNSTKKFFKSKENIILGITIICLVVIGLILTKESLAKDYKSASLSYHRLCLEVGRGELNNIDQFLTIDSSLKNINFKDNNNYVFTEKQRGELARINIQCGMSLAPPYYILFKFFNSFSIK